MNDYPNIKINTELMRENDLLRSRLADLRALNAELVVVLEDLLDTLPILPDGNAMAFYRIRAAIAKAKWET